MVTFLTGLLLLNYLVMFVMWLWVLVVAGREGALYVVLCIFVPFYILYYIISRFDEVTPAGPAYLGSGALQIVHVAYSPTGKVALTGYVNDRNDRADQLVGLWTADVVRGVLLNLRQMPAPDSPNGITDLQWTPDGTALIYRETIPYGPTVRSARYDGVSGFRIVRLDVSTNATQVLYESGGRRP